MEDKPLVSVVVVTYNSMPYVLETLESIKAQTYQNVELIVTDDCSQKDNTIEAVFVWLAQNKGRFVRTELVTTEKNTGVAGNVNRGVAKARGEWIKDIAGDDKLKPTYLEEIIDFCQSSGYDIACTDIENFGVGAETQTDFWRKAIEKIRTLDTAKAQYEELMKANFIPASSLIFKRSVYDEAGGFDEDCQFLEDYPFNLTVTAKGHCIRLLDKKLVMYRESEGSVRYNPRMNMSFNIFKTKYVNPNRFWYLWLKFFNSHFSVGSFFWNKSIWVYEKVQYRIPNKIKLLKKKLNL